jgi:hypothetical protein
MKTLLTCFMLALSTQSFAEDKAYHNPEGGGGASRARDIIGGAIGGKIADRAMDRALDRAERAHRESSNRHESRERNRERSERARAARTKA